MSGVDRDALFGRTLRLCAWSGIASIIFFVIGGVILGRMIPPLLAPNDSADIMVQKISENVMSMRVGSVFQMISFALFAVYGAGIAAQTRRCERSPGFSYIQLMFTACGTLVALLVAFSWALMSFRPGEYEPTVIQYLADYAYFLAVYSVPVFGGWCLMIALPILMVPEAEAPFPRWVGYLNVWAAVLFAPGQMVLFFKSGPFSWNGIVALWLPFVAFFLWILVMCIMMLEAAKRHGN